MLNDLVKKNNKYLIIYLLVAFVGTFIPIVPAVIILDSNPNSVLGIILIIIGCLIFVASTVIYSIIGRKLNKEINELRYQSDLEKMTTKTGNRTFKTINGEVFEFNEEFFLIDNKANYYNNYSCIASFRVQKDLFIPCIVLGSEDSEAYTIDIDGDLLDVLNESKLEVLNKDELDFYLENIKLATKQAIKTYSFNPSPYLVMEFKKNKADAKKFNKRTFVYVIVSIIMFIFIIGVNVLLIWLGDSKEGIEFSNKIGIDVIVKIIFSIILLLLIFVKASKYSIYTKIIIGLYLVIFWICRFFFDDRDNLLLDYIFMIVFLLCGVYESYRTWKEDNTNKNLYNRYYGIALFLAIMEMFVAFFNFTFIEEGEPWLVALFVDIFFLIVVICYCIFYIRKHKEKTKKEKISFVALLIFWTLMGGYYFAIISIINLNYALDKSIPIINCYEIVELENGDDNESDTATIIIDGKEFEISISDEEYHKLSVGDKLEVYYYEGAFGIAYYIHYSE